MVRTQKLTAEALLGAPRRTAGVPNASGTLALYTLSTHDFASGTTLKELKVMELGSTRSRTITVDEAVSEAVWLPSGDGEHQRQQQQDHDDDEDDKDENDDDDDHHHHHQQDEVVVLRALKGGVTQVVVADGRVDGEGAYIAGEIGAPMRAMKVKGLGDGTVGIVVAGLVGRDGELFNDEDEGAKPRSTGRVFDTANVRVWTELRKEQRYSLWYTRLERRDGGRWRLGARMHSLVGPDSLEAPASMYDGDPADMFDVGARGVVFLAKELARAKPHEALFTAPYYVGLESFALPPPGPPRRIERVGAEGRGGGGSNIRIAGDDSSVAFLYKDEADLQDTRLYTGSVEALAAMDVSSELGVAAGAYGHGGGGGCGSQDPYVLDGFEFWGAQGQAMILKRQRHGRDELAFWRRGGGGGGERVLWNSGSVAAFHTLGRRTGGERLPRGLLVSAHSFTDSSAWYAVRHACLEGAAAWAAAPAVVAGAGADVTCVSSLTRHGAMFGLHEGMVGEFWFPGADEHMVHSWMIRPSDFDERRAYPWVLMPHGGPISAWQDAWSTRWNAAAWAEQGYIVICPNISGSTGFGLEFTKRVEGQWGGNPFRDLVHLLEYVEQLPFLDQTRAVLAGASYGGYLVSWFLGDPIISRFCCAIWHDGIFSLPSFSLQSDLVLDNREYGPSPYPWLSAGPMARWDPARPERLRNWARAPPTLVVASARDFRCPVTEGLAAFTALQALGVRSRFLTFADEGHWVLREENALVWHRTVWEWMAGCVGKGAAGGEGEEE
ncbi:Dipeptidyl-peptidase 5 [Escovopsis weberi]|uniref:Dipeptidyl-peptidase V n=1 Tax=Escovopsis weberi TaxID=150374 RepID=A0A0M9VXJ7_ESCWE|nr:Dipeptidyl-peptidase 5 [Escovopsis weberi]